MRVALLASLGLLLACTPPPRQPDPSAGAAAPPPARWIDALPVADAPVSLDLRIAGAVIGIDPDGTLRRGAARDDDPLAGAPAIALDALAVAPPPSYGPGGSGTSWGTSPPDRGHRDELASDPVALRRLTTAFGDPIVDGGLRAGAVVLLPAAAAPAAAIADVLGRTGGVIAVRRGDQLRALPVAFSTVRPVQPGFGWTEVRITDDAVVQVIPSAARVIPPAGGRVDAGAIAAAIGGGGAVDLLVGDRVDAQTLVDLVDALADAGVAAISLGRAPPPGSADQVARATPGPHLMAAGPLVEGPLDPALARRELDAAHGALRRCLAAIPADRVSAALGYRAIIRPDGKVGRILVGTPVGDVSAETRGCVTDAIGALRFPGGSELRQLDQSLAFYR